jgi:hypothetical protein
MAEPQIIAEARIQKIEPNRLDRRWTLPPVDDNIYISGVKTVQRALNKRSESNGPALQPATR